MKQITKTAIVAATFLIIGALSSCTDGGAQPLHHPNDVCQDISDQMINIKEGKTPQKTPTTENSQN